MPPTPRAVPRAARAPARSGPPPAALLAASLALVAPAPPARADGPSYRFLSAPHVALNRVYRVDAATGEMGACQYGLKDNAVGVTLCYPAGDGAGPQPAGDYALVASAHQQEAGIYRVNRRTGEMSVCYVLNDERVVCTPQAR